MKINEKTGVSKLRYKKLANNVIVNPDNSIYFTPIESAASLSSRIYIEEEDVNFVMDDIEIQKTPNVFFEAVLMTVQIEKPNGDSYSVGIILSDFGNYISSMY